MSQMYQQATYADRSAGQAIDARARFIVRTYNHLFGAIAAFAALEYAMFSSGVAGTLLSVFGSTGWLPVLGGFILVSWLATRAAHSSSSKPVQYAALGGFVLAEAIIFVPLLAMANAYAPGAITSAGLTTMVGFAGLTGIAFKTRKDFSFLRSALMWGGVVALLLIVAGSVFGFALGTFFSVAMVGLAGGAILYDTSNILLHYPKDRHVGAALQLFASVAMMFWYVLRIFIGSRD